MHYDDPARPRIGDRPAYIDAWGAPVAVLPAIMVTPRPGGWRLSVMLRCERGSAAWYNYDVEAAKEEEHWDLAEAKLHMVFTAYKRDPEWVLCEYFQWDNKSSRKAPPQAPKVYGTAQPKVPITLAMLGLAKKE